MLSEANMVISHVVSDSLNPCFNGICSLSAVKTDMTTISLAVLILVLMEYAL